MLWRLIAQSLGLQGCAMKAAPQQTLLLRSGLLLVVGIHHHPKAQTGEQPSPTKKSDMRNAPTRPRWSPCRHTAGTSSVITWRIGGQSGLSVCIHTCMYTICGTCMYTHVHILIPIPLRILHNYICMYIYIYLYMYIYIQIYRYIHTYAEATTYVCVYVYIHR